MNADPRIDALRRVLGPLNTLLVAVAVAAVALAGDWLAFRLRPEGPTLFHYAVRLAVWLVMAFVFLGWLRRLRRTLPRGKSTRPSWLRLRQPFVIAGLAMVVALEVSRMLLEERVGAAALTMVHSVILVLFVVPMAFFGARTILCE